MNKDKMAVFVAGDKGSGENVMQIVFNADLEGRLSVQARMLTDANGNQWSDIQGAPEWVLKSAYDEKIAALEARLEKLEGAATQPVP